MPLSLHRSLKDEPHPAFPTVLTSRKTTVLGMPIRDGDLPERGIILNIDVPRTQAPFSGAAQLSQQELTSMLHSQFEAGLLILMDQEMNLSAARSSRGRRCLQRSRTGEVAVEKLDFIRLRLRHQHADRCAHR
ncbi:MAG: hypothetical protein JO283_15600 [Bradyrhizobium sp.]|nr:hypothetical protein [Bradyrhizobium sp.]